MMANHHVVIIKEAQLLSRQIDQLEPYIDNPTPSTILVICYKYNIIDGRKNLVKKSKKKTVYLETKKLYDNKIPDWISAYLKDKSYTITIPAATLIAEFLGTDLSKIANELNKLIINVPEGIEITPELVEKILVLVKTLMLSN